MLSLAVTQKQRRRFTRRFAALSLLAAACMGGGVSHSDVPAVAVARIRVPDGGIQPQAIVDTRGVLHLVYFRGTPAHGDLFYVHKTLEPDGPFSPPIRVNSQPGSAVALGTIRGAQIAVGNDGGVHVVWNGSDRAVRSDGQTTPMLYARLRAGSAAFDAERNLLAGTEVIDGGGSVAADPGSGTIYVLWHAVTRGSREASGGLYLTRTLDGGKTFAPERRIPAPPVGTCGCCGMRAIVNRQGTLYVLYRAATNDVDRDAMQLTSRDGGATFQQTDLQPWRADICPMSLFGLASSPRDAGVIGTWETQGRVYVAPLASGQADPPLRITAVPRGSGDQKYPVVAVRGDGRSLVAWAEGAGWNHGGALVWQAFDADGHPIATPGRMEGGVPAWSLPAVIAEPNGTFALIY